MTITITGIAATTRILDDLPKKQQKKILPKAARAGAGPFLKAAKAAAPKTNRLLQRSLITIVRRYPAGAYAIIGQEKVKAEDRVSKRGKRHTSGGISGSGYAAPIHLVEEATKAHDIRPKRASVLAFGFDRDLGRSNFARRVRHPGTRGQHFMRKAAVRAESQAVKAFTDKLRTETLAEAGRLGT